ncbi:MAG: 50S ribosomal protein L21 [Candidatus Cloacimonetes bacterium]|nr:50S ribosomal protein L21 [Candidatus Cloacimonadota bacterium]
MYAIIDYKGKQFKVAKDDIVKVPFVSDKEEGDELVIDKILLYEDDDETKIGKPNLDKVKIKAEVVEHGKDKKIIVFKKKRRKSYSRKYGHRTKYTKIKINEISE